jgi:DNA-binding NarL/FixJ family response regulator
MGSEGGPGRRRIRVLIAEAHPIVRRGFISLFQQQRDFEIVADAADGWVAVESSMHTDPDVALLNVSLPRLNGIDATRHIKRNNPRTKVLLLALHGAADDLPGVLEAGADGYLPYNCTADHLFGAIRALHAGVAHFATTLWKTIVHQHLRVQGWPAGRVAHELGPRLTFREREVLQLIAEGHTHREAAEILRVSHRTVDTHANNIMRKLDIHDPAGLTAYAVKTGIMHIPRR